jgi:hypothetical protein
MRWVLFGVALFVAVPAQAAEFTPEIASFAYTARPAPAAVPFDYAPALLTQPPLQNPPGFPATPAAAATANPQFQARTRLCSTVAFEAATNKIPIRFFANMIEQESSFNPHVVSSAGAQGIAQFMPGTAAEQGLNDPFEPMKALSASAKFVAYLVARFGNLGLAAAAYNAGPQRVDDWLAKRGGLPAETQHYVRQITGIPVEDWAKPNSKGEEITLPPFAECPQLQTPGSETHVNTRIAALAGVKYPYKRGRRWTRWSGLAATLSRISPLKYVVLSSRR